MTKRGRTFGAAFIAATCLAVLHLSAPAAFPASITTVAGICGVGCSPSGTSATAAALNGAFGVAISPITGEVYFSDDNGSVIRRVSKGKAVIVAGQCGSACGFPTGSGVKATSTTLCNPAGLAFDSAGNLYISDAGNSCIRKVSNLGSTNPIITTVAGYCATAQGGGLPIGDDGPALDARFAMPMGVAIDPQDNLFIADWRHGRVRKIDAQTQIITSVASSIDPLDVAVDATGHLYIAGYGLGKVYKVDLNNNNAISVIAGNGLLQHSVVSGQPATQASLYPWTVAVDPSGNVYVADLYKIISKLTPVGSEYTISDVAGSGVQGCSANSKSVNLRTVAMSPRGIVPDSTGASLYFADQSSTGWRIRKITW